VKALAVDPHVDHVAGLHVGAVGLPFLDGVPPRLEDRGKIPHVVVVFALGLVREHPIVGLRRLAHDVCPFPFTAAL
jgi:hypothetical protein